MLVKNFGEAIKNRRKELSITQPHLAELAKVSTNTLYKLERGHGNPSFDVLNKLADVLGMEIRLEVKMLVLVALSIIEVVAYMFWVYILAIRYYIYMIY